MKELNYIEVMKMPVGSKFKVKAKYGIFKDEFIIARSPYGTKILEDSKGVRITLNKFVKALVYELIEGKPVTINEVLNSNKLCKIKHKDLYYRNESYYKEYHSLEDLLHELTEDYSDARAILREAEWYLQED